jgi:hypothetical protein
MQSMPRATSPYTNNLTVFAFLVFLVIICHGLSLKADFMCDDFYYLQPEKIVGIYPKFTDFFLRTPGHHYNPLDVILNFYLFKTLLTPLLLYGVNLILFSINSFLLFINVKIITQNRSLAILTAVLFTIHPLNADNLSHITFNTVFLSAIFLQLSLLGFWHYLSSPQAKKRWFTLSLLSYLFALLFLETALLFPGYLCALCLLKPVRERLRAFLLTLPFWTLSFAYFILWFVMTRENSVLAGKINHLNISIASYIATFGLLLKWYIGNLLFPEDPVFIKSSAVVLDNMWPIIAGVIASFTAILFMIYRWHANTKGFALLCFMIGFIFMIPASLVHAYSMGMVIEPNWFLFSSMGFFLFLALILQDIKSKINVVLYRGLISVIIIFWAITSYRQHVIAQNEVSYLEYWSTTSPGNSIPSLRLGSLYGLTNSLKIPQKLISEMDRQLDFYIKTKQYNEAAALVEKMIISSPENPKRQLWQYMQVALDWRITQPPKAAASLTDFQSTIHTEDQYLMLAIQFDRVEIADQALAILDQGLNHIPQSVNLIYLKAALLANQNRFDESESTINAQINEVTDKSRLLELLQQIKSLKNGNISDK